MIRCLIIEDDLSIVETIKAIGNDFSDISLYASAENHESALNLVLKVAPDIVFINIQTIKISLCEFLFDISEYGLIKPHFIALSSTKENAFDAFAYGFADYLLKPLSELTLRKSFLKGQKSVVAKRNETICLKSNKDYQYLNIDEILYLKADNNTTDFYMADGRIVGAYKTLKVFEDQLPQTFIRIHKSFIINKNCISRINYSKSIFVINNAHEIPFTKTFNANIESIFNDLSNSTIVTLN
ncbi:response regulator transcription factor [Aequorivita sp. H23M31]|uniref:Response regulator transcription factor n=1 Tax=Aequorivita ciconiae TaxID=2494375 RepID=A0A410G2N2_9FLAO|nr:LytTR family DNA-binding domain-containing protein [Aequorivita sp. H23M31]QAA81501.1 response regulator transcription factor [Aequorivita sp. H23M31]